MSLIAPGLEANLAIGEFVRVYSGELPFAGELVGRGVAAGKLISVRPGETIRRVSGKDRRAVLLFQGILRRYTVSDSGKEVTLGFHKTGTIYDPWASMRRGSASATGLEAVQDSWVLLVEGKRWRSLVDSDPRWYQLLYFSLLDTAIGRLHRDRLLLSGTATLRYEHFARTDPYLASTGKAHHIASYLGMTPETLSRIRTMVEGPTP